MKEPEKTGEKLGRNLPRPPPSSTGLQGLDIFNMIYLLFVQFIQEQYSVQDTPAVWQPHLPVHLFSEPHVVEYSSGSE